MFAVKTRKNKTMKNKLTIIIPLLMLGALVGGCDSSTSKETYIYGPCKFCHKPGYARGKWADAQEMVDNGDKRALGGQRGLTTVLGMMERGGRVVTIVCENNGPSILKWHILRHVDRTATLFTDQHHAYTHVDAFYKRFSVDHDIEFVSGDAHTNNLECYWSLLKRSLRGTYVAVDPWHLYRYCEEQQFRFNFRKLTDGQRFEVVAQQVTGRRLTYRELTGKEYLPIQ